MTGLRFFRATLAAVLSVCAVTFASGQNSMPEIVAPAARDVTPPGITPGPVTDGPLTREPTPPRPPDPPRWRRYFLPETSNASTFHIKDLTIRISGVTGPAPDAMCQRLDGTEWPCGRAALYAFRMYLSGRAVECYFPHVESAIDITAPCRVGRADLGLWLVSQGWVMPDDLATDDYHNAADIARCARRGLWRWTEQSEDSCRGMSRGQTTLGSR